jgi:hypothetical protein
MHEGVMSGYRLLWLHDSRTVCLSVMTARRRPETMKKEAHELHELTRIILIFFRVFRVFRGSFS